MKRATMKKLLPILIPVFCAILATASMEPTIHQGSLILGLRQFGELHTGDIVIFRRDGRTLVKRIVASPGESYNLNGSPVTVPAGHYLLLGDNAADSYDARYWKEPFTGIECIIAKVVNLQ